jgi:hypothetical protein
MYYNNHAWMRKFLRPYVTYYPEPPIAVVQTFTANYGQPCGRAFVLPDHKVVAFFANKKLF